MDNSGIPNFHVYICAAMRNGKPTGGYELPNGTISNHPAYTLSVSRPIYRLKLYVRLGSEMLDFVNKSPWSIPSNFTTNLRELDIMLESYGLIDARSLWNKVFIWITEMLPNLRTLNIVFSDGLCHEMLYQARKDYPYDVGQGLTRVFFSVQFFRCLAATILQSCDLFFNLALTRREDGGPVAGPWSAISTMLILKKIAMRCIERNRQAHRAMEVAVERQVAGFGAVRFIMPCHLGDELKRLASR